MVTTVPSNSESWILPNYQRRLSTTLPNYEQPVPIRVNREGVQNYIKNRGTFNFSDWATEGRRMSISSATSVAESTTTGSSVLAVPPPKVIGADAIRNYIQSRSSTPNLIHGDLAPPDPHHHHRVKKEGRANYEKNQHTQMKQLFENYGKLPISKQPLPHTQGEMATNLFYEHQEGHLGSLLNEYGRTPPSPKPVPNVLGVAAENNLKKGLGDSNILTRGTQPLTPTPEPNVIGLQAQINYEMGQGRKVDKLITEYGKLPQSARTAPKVKYDGVQNYKQAQGDAMRKTLSQCPPSYRTVERPPSVPLWS